MTPKLALTSLGGGAIDPTAGVDAHIANRVCAIGTTSEIVDGSIDPTVPRSRQLENVPFVIWAITVRSAVEVTYGVHGKGCQWATTSESRKPYSRLKLQVSPERDGSKTVPPPPLPPLSVVP
jgi:hypothetical protein